MTQISQKVANYTDMKDKYFPHKELSYKLVGIFFNIANNYGNAHKELIYQNALDEELTELEIPFKREIEINIFSVKSNKKLGKYRADFLIDNKIIVEVKALKFIPSKLEQQIFKYLKSTPFELGYLVNFGSNNLFFKRYILSNSFKKSARSV